ncbi:hypothetical protein [Motilibacter deserti]|nr:hypothetical protein [Motilibacter deserti]
MNDYTPPQITVMGTLEQLTAASVSGSRTDVPLGTPIGPSPIIFS